MHSARAVRIHLSAQRIQVELTRWSGLRGLVDEDQRGHMHRQAVVLNAQVAGVQLAEPLGTTVIAHLLPCPSC